MKLNVELSDAWILFVLKFVSLFFLYLYSEINFSSNRISYCIQHSLWFAGEGKDSVVNDIVKQAIFRFALEWFVKRKVKESSHQRAFCSS